MQKLDRTQVVPPNVVAAIVKVTSDPNSSVREVAAVVKTDPTISAQLLKVINAPFYGLRSKVTSIDTAVGQLGTRAVRNLVLAFGVLDLVPQNSVAEFPLDLYWEASVLRAEAAKAVSQRLSLNRNQIDTAFTVGLCQDLGIVLNLQSEPMLQESMAKALRKAHPMRLLVERNADFDHAEFGGQLFANWELPEEIVEPIRYHHYPEGAQAHRDLAKVANAAECISDLMFVNEKRATMRMTQKTLSTIGLDTELPGILGEMRTAVESIADVLQLSIGEYPTWENLVEMTAEPQAIPN